MNAAQESAQRALQGFRARGYAPTAFPELQPAGPFLAYMGEDARRRLYLVRADGGDEYCLCPDLTIPACQAYLAQGRPRARVAYAAPAYRARADGAGSSAPRRLMQAGLENFGAPDAEAAEAEIVAALAQALAAEGRATTMRAYDPEGALAAAEDAGDGAAWLAWARAAERGGAASAARALMRWARGGDEPTLPAGLAGAYARLDAEEAEALTRDVVALADAEETLAGRSLADVAARGRALASLTRAPLLREATLAFLDATDGQPLARALERARSLARGEASALGGWLASLERRLALAAEAGVAGFAEAQVVAEGFGGVDYYSGLRFDFVDEAGVAVASGGRYDALLRALGGGEDARGVGGALRFALDEA